MIVRPVNGMTTGNLLKMPITLVRPDINNPSADEDLPMDSDWIPQVDDKITSAAPANRSIRPSQVATRPVNPILWRLFYLYWAVFIVKYPPKLIKITILLFVRPFPGRSRNTVPIPIVAKNVCVIGVILGLTVTPPIDQSDSRQEGHSAITHIHD
jgi:hypothetical protein